MSQATTLPAAIEPLSGPLPSLTWRWDPETDILSGSFQGTRRAAGLTGTVEISDEVGSVAVLDVANGAICGLDMVVWPEVATLPALPVPAALTDGRVVLPSRPGVLVDAVEIDAPLTARASADESAFHLRLGTEQPSEVVRVANHLYIELAHGAVAGFWLIGVPPFPAGGEY